MSEAESFHADVEWLNWHRPALQLVAEKLLALPEETLRRATVVVPTSGSGRRLKEYMAECSGHGLLMPKIILVTQLLSTDSRETATWSETRAAWVKVLSELMAEEWQETGKWADLFPQKPQGNVCSWAHHAAEMLCHFRKTLEQECVDDAYVQLVRSRREQAESRNEKKLAAYFDRLDTRWELIHELFKRVDRQITKSTKKSTQEHSRAKIVAQPPLLKGTLIFACVPEVSPQTRLYLQHYTEQGGKVAIWVNAPQTEAGLFDAFGQPKTDCWLTRPISFPRDKDTPKDFDEASCLHLVRDAKAMGRKAVELAAATETADVALISCDTAMDAALADAFEHPQKGSPWKLFLPAGRAAKSSPVLLWLTQLQKAVQMLQTRPVSQEGHPAAVYDAPAGGFEPLLRNRFLQQLYVVKRQAAWEKAKTWDAEKRKECENFLLGFNRYLDRINQIFFPDTAAALLNTLQNTEMLKKKLAPCRFIAIDYVRDVKTLLENLSRDAHVWQHWATYLRMFATAPQQVLTYVGDFDMLKPLQKEAQLLAETISEVTDCAVSFDCSAEETFALLLQTVQKNAKALPLSVKDECHADLNGWKEATFTKEERMIVCGMHGHCLPEPVSGDIMLPNTLRLPIGMACAESREARDAFLYTALLNSRKAGQLHVVVAQQKDDGEPISPSTLLLHCGDDLTLLAKRAAYFFGDAPTEVNIAASESPWLLRHGVQATDTEGMESIALLGKSDKDNPYADITKKFSASRIHDFLSCPLRFWMKTLLKMDARDTYQPDKMDMDAKEYGTVLHGALCHFTERYPDKDAVCKAMGRRELQEGDAAAMVGFLQHEAEEILNGEFTKQFGEDISLALTAQQRMQTASLRIFAYQYAHELLQGWVNLFRELKLNLTIELQDGSPAEFTMTLDRVDYLPDEGRWRIIDYKTHGSGPNEKYYATAKKGDVFHSLMGAYFPLIEETPATGKTAYYRWRDIQLPLYALGLQHLLKTGKAATPEAQRQVEAAKQLFPQVWQPQESTPMPELYYINIPKNKIAVSQNILHTRQKIRNSYKTPLTAEYEEHAMTWVKSACYLMRHGLCLYSAESLKIGQAYGDFSALTPGGDPRSLFGLK